MNTTKNYDPDKGMPYNPHDPKIWYNNPELKKIVLHIQEKLGEPILTSKDGWMIYEHFIIQTRYFNGEKIMPEMPDIKDL